MNVSKPLLFTILFLSAVSMLEAQPGKRTKGQLKYQSSYENKTLSPTEYPNLLPYNKWIDPAGTQSYFGDPNLENHALDVVFSPDRKWLAVEGRYEVLIISPQTSKIVASLPLSSIYKDATIMNTFSGICWVQEGNQYSLYWGGCFGYSAGQVG